MRILVTGSEGYLGSLLAPRLMLDGHDVVGVDTGYFRSGELYHARLSTPRTLARDVRELVAEDLHGCDAVVHLGELSNDPLGELHTEATYDVNHQGSVRLAELAKSTGVRRFVYMSSCSVYGVAEGAHVTEEAPLDPRTAYAVCKSLVERDVAAMVDDAFVPTFLRNATAYGASPRMRFDIVLNRLCGLAWTTKQITTISDGTAWRPLVHALDITKAIRCVLAAPAESVRGEVFNVGSNGQNYQVREIAEIVAGVFPGCEVAFGQQSSDERSYRVNFDKISTQLPGFSCDWNAKKGAEQLHQVFARIDLDGATFTGRGHTRLEQLRHLLRTRQLDENLFWRTE